VIARFVSAMIDAPEPGKAGYTAEALYESYTRFHARSEPSGTPLLTFEAFEKDVVMAMVEYREVPI
jgi:hypothetical protein